MLHGSYYDQTLGKLRFSQRYAFGHSWAVVGATVNDYGAASQATIR